MDSMEFAYWDMEDIRKKHLSREASLLIIGGLWILLGVFMMIWGAFCLLLHLIMLDFIAVGLVFLFILCGVFHLWIGLSLRNLRNWARITLGLLNIPGLIVYPIGTVLCGLFLYILFSKNAKVVCSKQYHEVIENTLHVKYPESVFVCKIFGGIFFLVLFHFIYGAIIGKVGS